MQDAPGHSKSGLQSWVKLCPTHYEQDSDPDWGCRHFENSSLSNLTPRNVLIWYPHQPSVLELILTQWVSVWKWPHPPKELPLTGEISEILGWRFCLAI